MATLEMIGRKNVRCVEALKFERAHALDDKAKVRHYLGSSQAIGVPGIKKQNLF